MLKYILGKADFDKLDEAFQKEYKVQADGNYHLDTGESPSEKEAKEKTIEFRNNNVVLLKKVEDFETRFKDVDPTKFKEMVDQIQLMKDKKLLEEGDIEGLLTERTERMVKDFNNKIKALETVVDEKTITEAGLTQRLSEVLIDSSIRDSVGDVGKLKTGAMSDAIARGRGVWKLVDGEPAPLGPDGATLYGADAKSALTFKEWATSLLETAPYLFESNSGGGAGGGAGAGGKGGGSIPDDIKNLKPGERLKYAHTLDSSAKQ